MLTRCSQSISLFSREYSVLLTRPVGERVMELFPEANRRVVQGHFDQAGAGDPKS
jgi:hypothetical protein